MIRVVLNSAGEKKGQIEFLSLLGRDGDDTCQPEGIVKPEQVREIRQRLSRLPQINAGIVGEYQWRVE